QILQSDPSTLKSFLDNAYRCFKRVNNMLKKRSNSQPEYQSIVTKIFADIHNFKGESSALGISEFVEMAHEFEDKLEEMKERDWLKGQDFLPLAVNLDKMIDYAQTITALLDRMSNFTRGSVSEGDNSPTTAEPSWKHLQTLASDLSGKYNKQTELVYSGLDDTAIPQNLKDIINSICIQFIRNSIVHGIESPDTRTAASKSPQGRIDIHLSNTPDNHFKLIFRDDGAGFDCDKIRQRAAKMGKWTDQELQSWDTKKLMSLIFTSGFSTADDVNEDAGRGVGMDIVAQKIRQLNGKISLSSRPNQYSSFTITFPLAFDQQAA
ncbi:MAG: ATP-binding protein, partial [Pseudomonadota bacterium]